MARKRYVYNEETLRYEPRSVSRRMRVLCLVRDVSVSLLIGLALMLVFTTIFDTPRSRDLARKRDELAVDFELLTNQVRNANRRIALVEMRDNNVYRTIFESDTIARSIREGGIGGAEHYRRYSSLAYGDSITSLAVDLDRLDWRTQVQSKSFEEVYGLALRKDRMMRSIPAVQPVSVKRLARIASYFGYRRDPFTKGLRMHNGLDFVAPTDTPIHATGDGLVVEAEYRPNGYGKQVLIDHGFGYKTRYAHLNSIAVQAGDRVTRGQKVGGMGNTGRSTGTHLHYEVLYRNRHVNPLLYFSEMGEEEYEQMLANAQIQELD